MVFIELATYTKAINKLLNEEEQRGLQTELALQPEAGKRIPRTGGLRKYRFALSSNKKGKSGGARIIYYLSSGSKLYLIFAYAKSYNETLNADQEKAFRSMVERIKKHDG